MVRVMRVLRLFRFLRPLRLMALSVLCCGQSLLWAFLLLAISIYLFAVFLGEGIRQYLRDPGLTDPEVASMLQEYHDGIWSSMLFLGVAIMGGNDWYDIAEPSIHM